MRTGRLPALCSLFALTLLAGCAPYPAPGAAPSASATRSAEPSTAASSSPTPRPTKTTDAATCDEITTAAFDTELETRGWDLWPVADVSPFGGAFGSLPEATVCTAGADEDAAAEELIDLAWAPLTPTVATAAQKELAELGYERIESAEGVYFAMSGDYGYGDAEGYAHTYLFTADDVRWANFKDHVKFVKAPDDVG